MSKSGKKPRHKKMDVRKVDGKAPEKKKREDDWGFEEIARSKTRRSY